MSLPLLFIQMYFSLSAPLMRTRLPNVSVSTMSLAVMGEGEKDLCLWELSAQGCGRGPPSQPDLPTLVVVGAPGGSSTSGPCLGTGSVRPPVV